MKYFLLVNLDKIYLNKFETKGVKTKNKNSIVNCLQQFRTSFQNLAMIYKSQHYRLGFLLIFSFIGVILALSANFKCLCKKCDTFSRIFLDAKRIFSKFCQSYSKIL